MLRYSVVNLNDAAATLGGFPFDNRSAWYTGSDNDCPAEPPRAARRRRSGRGDGDERVVPRRRACCTAADHAAHAAGSAGPYFHEAIYDLKTLASGSFLTRHLNIPIDRFEHCNFTRDEALFSFAVMLFYDGPCRR